MPLCMYLEKAVGWKSGNHRPGGNLQDYPGLFLPVRLERPLSTLALKVVACILQDYLKPVLLVTALKVVCLYWAEICLPLPFLYRWIIALALPHTAVSQISENKHSFTCSLTIMPHAGFLSSSPKSPNFVSISTHPWLVLCRPGCSALISEQFDLEVMCSGMKWSGCGLMIAENITSLVPVTSLLITRGWSLGAQSSKSWVLKVQEFHEPIF